MSEITYIGNPILYKVCEEVLDITSPEIQEICDNLIETLAQTKTGVWLAAPQIGYDKRIFLIWIKPTPRFPDLEDVGAQIIINPNIISQSKETWKLREWCLSVPELMGDVVRSKTIEVEYCDREGNQHTKEMEAFEARVFLHEYDHLDGILFLERMNNLKSLTCEKEVERLKKMKI